MKPNIEIAENHTKEIARLLNTLLADEEERARRWAVTVAQAAEPAAASRL